MQLRLDRFHLFGTAAGGGIAIAYAVTHPATVRSLVVTHSTLTVDEEESTTFAGRVLPTDFNKLPPAFREVGAASV